MDNVQRKIYQMREAIDHIKTDIETMKSVRNSSNGTNHQKGHNKSKSSAHVKGNAKTMNHFSNNTMGSIETNAEGSQHKMNLMQFKASAPIRKDNPIKNMALNSRNKPCSISHATAKKYNFNYPLEGISSIHPLDNDTLQYKKIPSLHLPIPIQSPSSNYNDPFQRITTETNVNTTNMEESIDAKASISLPPPQHIPNAKPQSRNDPCRLFNDRRTQYNTIQVQHKHNTIDTSNVGSNNFYIQRFQYPLPNHQDADDHKNTSTTSTTEYSYKTMVNEMIDLGNKYAEKKYRISHENLVENYQKTLRQLKLKDELINKMMRLYCNKTGKSVGNEKEYVLRLWQWVKGMAENEDKQREEMKRRRKREAEVNEYQVLCERIMSEYNLGDINELVRFINRLLQKVNKNDSFLEGIKKILLFKGRFDDENEEDDIDLGDNDF